MNDLIVMTFDNQEAAFKARQALEIMRNSRFLGVSNAVIATRDRAGKVVVYHQSELGARRPDPSSQMPGLLVNVIFGKPPEEGAQKLVDAGLDEGFVRKVASALGPDSSMTLNYVWRDSLVDAQQVVDALNQFEGTLHHTTVPAEVEEAILKQAEFE